MERRKVEYSIWDIFVAAKTISDTTISNIETDSSYLDERVDHYTYHDEFDFSVFLPKNTLNDSTDYYKIGYDSIGQIIEVNHFEEKTRLGNWKMILFHVNNIIIIGIEDWAEDFDRKATSYDFLPGFLVYLKESKTMYFVNTFALGHMQFGPFFPVFNLNDISYICAVNSNLQITHLFKFENLTLSNMSEIILLKDNRTILHQESYDLNGSFKLKGDLEFNSLLDHFIIQKESSKMQVVKPCMPPEDRGFPLLFFAGTHLYCN